MSRVAGILLAIGLVSLSAAIGGVMGVVYLALCVASLVPGLPVGFLLFGRRHPAGWVAGALAGYVMTAMAIWLAVVVGATSAGAMTSVWFVVCGASWLVFRGRGPLVALPDFGQRDLAALLLAVWLVPILASLPFLNVGARDEAGNRLYRAYFTADFLWHTALTAEVARFSSPPVNPYLASQPLHYYWTYFLLPAAASTHLAGTGLTVEHVLLVNALCAGVLFVGSFFVLTWMGVRRAWPALAACVFGFVSASAEGAYALWDVWHRHLPLATLKNVNVDAVVSWTFGGLRIDGLPRSLWYVPQHATACALGLVALTVIASTGAAGSLPAIFVSGFALAAAATMSPILGGGFSVVYAAAVVLDAIRTPRELPKALLRHALAMVPVIGALGWAYGNRVFEGATGALQLGYNGIARNSPVVAILLGLGPLLVLALAGLASRRWDRAATVGLAGLAVGIGALYFVWMPLDLAYVGFRAGQVLQLTLPLLAARFFVLAGASRLRRFAVVATLAVTSIVGLPTTIIDAYNAQDVTNRGQGPGFHWTVAVTPSQQYGLKWLQVATPRDAVVQADVVIRGREYWTTIPSFAHRRMAAGLPISLLRQREYAVAADHAHEMFTTVSGARACEIAHDLGIEYIYLDLIEKDALPQASVDKFRLYPDCFTRGFKNAEVEIFAVAAAVVPAVMR